MNEVWIHSMDGLPWTKTKMNKAVEILRPNATITFSVGNELPSILEDLNETIFKVRPDLILLFTNSSNSSINNELLESLTKMNFVKRIEFNGFKNKELSKISDMIQLQHLIISSKNKLDISFIEKLKSLTKISLRGTFNSLHPIKNCTELETIYLSTTIDSFDFFEDLNKIEEITIDTCIAPNDFTPLNKKNLQDLTINSVKMLEKIDGLADFTNLKSLKLDASQIKRLPKMDMLFNLKKLELGYMKKWENPEILKTLPALEELELQEINTKLKAEQFYFLTEMNTLKTVDFRFIDFNKGRIEKLNNYFKINGKQNILKID